MIGMNRFVADIAPKADRRRGPARHRSGKAKFLAEKRPPSFIMRSTGYHAIWNQLLAPVEAGKPPPSAVLVTWIMTNQNEGKPPSSNQAREATKALVATDVTITQKPFLRYVTGSIYQFERTQVLLFGCQNRVAR
jgi:hypothetical protein